MNEQEIFDRVIGAIFTQGNKALGEDGRPVYRNDLENEFCPIGFLIEQRFYKPEFEGRSVYNKEVFEAVVKSTQFKNDPVILKNLQRMLVRIQDMHDTYPVIRWAQRARQISQTYGLKWNFDG